MRTIVISGSASGIGLACRATFEAAYIDGMMLWVDGGTDAAIRPDRF